MSPRDIRGASGSEPVAAGRLIIKVETTGSWGPSPISPVPPVISFNSVIKNRFSHHLKVLTDVHPSGIMHCVLLYGQGEHPPGARLLRVIQTAQTCLEDPGRRNTTG